MAKATMAAATGPLDGQVAGSALVSIKPMEPASRLAIRARPDAIASLSKVLGVKLPQAPKTSAQSTAAKSRQRVALWLGPDEWLVIDDGNADLMGICAKAKGLYSAVDVSHRNTSVLVSGKGAEATISAGCPQNLSLDVFPVGACARTLLGKTEVVLYRVEEDVFRVECWRSFSTYVFAFLAEAGQSPMI